MAWPPVTELQITKSYKDRLKRYYNLSVEQYIQMLNNQGGCCWLCGLHFTNHYNNLFVDHCHKTNRIGKILCTNCNGALGHCRDSIEILEKSIHYLTYWSKDSSKWEWLDRPPMRHKRSFWKPGDFKKCSVCWEWKEVDTWFKTTNKVARGYRQYRPCCIKCNAAEFKRSKKGIKIGPTQSRYTDYEIQRSKRDSHYTDRYGITAIDYDTMLAIQNYGCAICNIKTLRSDEGDLAVDHCHLTGKVRGLLCFHCNLILGMLKENIEIMKNAINYLREYR
jgi:hypothetical protein